MSQDQTVAGQATVPASEAYAKTGRAKEKFILAQLVGKDFKRKYRRSVLGVVWSVLNPLLKKVRINKTVFPVERVLFALVNFAFSLIAVVIVMLWEGVLPTWTVILLPVLLVLLMGFCIGMSLLLSSLAVFFRDIIHLWSVVILAWSYVTPLFWPVSMIAQVPYAFMRVIMLANPMYNYVAFMRMILLNGQPPELITVAMCVFWAVFMLAVGYAVFRKLQRKFILYI